MVRRGARDTRVANGEHEAAISARSDDPAVPDVDLKKLLKAAEGDRVRATARHCHPASAHRRWVTPRRDNRHDNSTRSAGTSRSSPSWGRKSARAVPFGPKTARALDAYFRARKRLPCRLRRLGGWDTRDRWPTQVSPKCCGGDTRTPGWSSSPTPAPTHRRAPCGQIRPGGLGHDAGVRVAQPVDVEPVRCLGDGRASARCVQGTGTGGPAVIRLSVHVKRAIGKRGIATYQIEEALEDRGTAYPSADHPDRLVILGDTVRGSRTQTRSSRTSSRRTIGSAPGWSGPSTGSRTSDDLLAGPFD